MKLKAGVSLRGIEPQTAVGMAITDSVFKNTFGHDCTITSVNDGTEHKSGSLHYRGRAFDVRTHDIPSGLLDTVLGALKSAFTDEWDILIEFRGDPREHVHLEWDPKV